MTRDQSTGYCIIGLSFIIFFPLKKRNITSPSLVAYYGIERNTIDSMETGNVIHNDESQRPHFEWLHIYDDTNK